MLHEKTSVLTAHQIPEAPNGTTLPVLANVSIIPQELANTNASFAAAEIVISEPSEAFPDPLIYVSNRKLGDDVEERGDTIAIFEFSGFTSGSNGTDETASIPSSETASETVSETVSEPTATQTIRLAPAFTTLVAAPADTAAVRRAEPKSKRMVKYHARQRAPHEHARRQGYGSYPESEASSSAAAATGTTITLGSASETATATGTAQPTSTPTGASLRLTNQVFTGLAQIRSFAIGKSEDGGDEFLIAGANTQGGVAVFRRTDGGRNLTLVARNVELESRTSFVFL